MPSFLASAKSLMSVLLHSLLNIILGFKMYSQIGVIFTSQYNFQVYDTHLLVSLFSLFSVQPTVSLNSHGQR
jgi:hypothetical protein